MKRLIALLCGLALLAACACAEGTDFSGVADASQMTDVIDVAPEGLTPVTADQLNDGAWEVAVDSSSSMFKVVGCTVTVSGGALTAKLYMKSEAYSHLYPGAAEEAAAAPVEALIPLEVSAEGYSFEMPIDALDVAVTCAAFSAKKQVWYPRTLRFRADSLPEAAWREDARVTARSLGLADGEYAVAVALEGGRTAVESATLIVDGDACAARVVFDTAKIDYVVVDGEKVLPEPGEGNAAFLIPVAGLDRGLSIRLDSTAVKPAVEVPYTITFLSEGLSAQP